MLGWSPTGGVGREKGRGSLLHFLSQRKRFVGKLCRVGGSLNLGLVSNCSGITSARKLRTVLSKKKNMWRFSGDPVKWAVAFLLRLGILRPIRGEEPVHIEKFCRVMMNWGFVVRIWKSWKAKSWGTNGIHSVKFICSLEMVVVLWRISDESIFWFHQVMHFFSSFLLALCELLGFVVYMLLH